MSLGDSGIIVKIISHSLIALHLNCIIAINEWGSLVPKIFVVDQYAKRL